MAAGAAELMVRTTMPFALDSPHPDLSYLHLPLPLQRPEFFFSLLLGLVLIVRPVWLVVVPLVYVGSANVTVERLRAMKAPKLPNHWSSSIKRHLELRRAQSIDGLLEMPVGLNKLEPNVLGHWIYGEPFY